MSELSSVYARVRLSRAALQRFLDAPIAPIDRNLDWGVLGPQVPSILSMVRYPEPATNGLWFDQVHGRQEAASDWTYEESTGEFHFHMLQVDESLVEYVGVFNVLRSLGDFKDSDGEDFAVVYPYYFDDRVDAVCRIGKGSSSLELGAIDSPEFRAFMSAADQWLQAVTNRLS
jgi:hypothetical protein